MKTVVGITFGIWLIYSSIAIVSAVTKSSTIIQQTPNPNPKLTYTVLTLDLNEPTTEQYLAFIIALRTAIRADHLVCTLPVLKQTARTEERFILVNLETKPSTTLTIAIDVHDLYVVGYQDKIGNQNRANFLKEIPRLANTHLFPGSIVRNIPFTGHYTELEKQGVDRDTIPLGLYALKAAANAVYGAVKPRPAVEAKFLILAIGMISEAARFKYIAQQIRRNEPYESDLPNPKVLKLENSWGPLSEGIIWAGARDCGELKSQVTLFDADNNQYTVRNVSQVVADMGILSNPPPRPRVEAF